MQTQNPIRLTQTVKKGGCAAKVSAMELRKILSQVNFPVRPSEILIDGSSFDDAAVYKINSELALVQTLDFFTPIVDTPKIFGRIAAANALSDVYAMGGRPVTALAILGFPLSSMASTIIVDVLQGATDIVSESKASLVGGHTIDDDTLKFGLSVTGFVHPDRIWSNAGAKPGDVLILSKPLGTGTLTAALKRGEATETEIQEALDSMCQLNDVGGVLSTELSKAIHAATDITGFGFAGHAFNLATASQVSLMIEGSRLPHFQKTREFLEKGFLTKAHRTNAEYVSGKIHFERAESFIQQLVFDPQTSGGLLLAVEPNASEEVLSQISKRFEFAQIVGKVSAKKSASIQIS